MSKKEQIAIIALLVFAMFISFIFGMCVGGRIIETDCIQNPEKYGIEVSYNES